MVPYVTAIVDLEEGGRMMTNLVDVEPDPVALTVGMPLEVTFDDVTDEVTLPQVSPDRGVATVSLRSESLQGTG